MLSANIAYAPLGIAGISNCKNFIELSPNVATESVYLGSHLLSNFLKAQWHGLLLPQTRFTEIGSLLIAESDAQVELLAQGRFRSPEQGVGRCVKVKSS